MPTEIVQVIQEFSSDGGAENVSWELARAFARAGIPNRVITNRVGGVVEPGITIEVVAPWLTRIPTRGLLRHIGRFVVVPAFSFAATVALRRHPQAVVITHGDSLGGDILVVHAVNAASLASKRADGLWHWMLNPIHLWVALRDRWMINGLRYRCFVAVSRRVLSELHDYHRVPEDRIRIIPNGIDLARFTPDPEARRAVRAEFGIAEDTKLMLFVGHEFSRKGLAHAIGALKQLGPEYRLMVVGSENPGPYRDLAGARRDDVIFAGARSDVPIFFAASDALVLPTSYETFSLVCMEAMATGVPVFATAVGGIEDYLVDGVNGWVIQAEAGDIAATIHRALSDPEQAASLREGALETARRYGWPMISRQYIALVDEIAQAKKAGRGLPQAV